MATNNGADATMFVNVVRYKECMHNHAAQLGLKVRDGCGEYASSGEADTLMGMYCVACGCHRSFHRKVEVEESSSSPSHRPKMIRFIHRSANADLPPSPRQPAIPLGGREIEEEEVGRKNKSKTKFTQAQKERLKAYAEELGWTLRGHDKEEIGQFCFDIGITHKVFKNWVNNNKLRMQTRVSSLTSRNRV